MSMSKLKSDIKIFHEVMMDANTARTTIINDIIATVEGINTHCQLVCGEYNVIIDSGDEVIIIFSKPFAGNDYIKLYDPQLKKMVSEIIDSIFAGDFNKKYRCFKMGV